MPLKGFSLSFYKRETDTGKLSKELGEYVFLNGPTSFEESFPQRISVDPTFYGYTVTDFGNDVSRIRLEGEFHIYFYARPQTIKSGATNSSELLTQERLSNTISNYLSDTISEAVPIPGASVRTGKMEFFDFMGMLHSIRKDGNFSGNSVQSQEIVVAGAFNATEAGKGKFNYAEYGIIYRDYERKRYVEVVPAADGFSINRSVEDTNTFHYSMSWIGLKDEAELKADGFISETMEKLQFFNPSTGLASAINTIGSIMRLPLVVTGALLSVTGFIKQLSKTADLVKAEYEDAKKNLTNDGKQLKDDFNEIKKSVNKFVGKKDKKSVYDRIIDQSNYNDKLFEYYSSEYQRFRQRINEYVTQAENLFVNAGSIVLTPPIALEDAVTTPFWDSTDYIDSDLYDFIWNAYYEGILAEVFVYFSGIDTNWTAYFVNGGETFTSIAESELGDATLSTALADYNNLSVNQNISGMVLKLPFARPTLQTYSSTQSNNPSSLEERLLGQDLALSQGRGILVDSTGDLATLSGELAYANNMIDMLDYPIGSLPFWKQWGNPAEIGVTATDWERELYFEKIVQSLRSDPRTTSANIEYQVQDGNVMSIEIKVISIWGKQSHYFSL